MLEQIGSYLPFLIPLAIAQLGLMLAAIIHILRHDTFRFGNKLVWILVSVLINIIGPVLYFVIGRGESVED
jgi:multisubunit Na+/H+ antiporter MnhG subunit